MTDKRAEADLVSAQLHATWGMLIERGVIIPRDIDTIKSAANDRLRDKVKGGDAGLYDAIDGFAVRMRAARRA